MKAFKILTILLAALFVVGSLSSNEALAAKTHHKARKAKRKARREHRRNKRKAAHESAATTEAPAQEGPGAVPTEAPAGN